MEQERSKNDLRHLTEQMLSAMQLSAREGGSACIVWRPGPPDQIPVNWDRRCHVSTEVDVLARIADGSATPVFRAEIRPGSSYADMVALLEENGWPVYEALYSC